MGTPKLTGSGLIDCPLGGALPFVTVGTTSNNDYVIDGNSGINNNTVYTSIDGSVTYTYANGISVGAGINTANSNNVFFCAAGIELLASSTGIAIGNSVYSASIVDNSSGGWIASATMNKILP